MANLFLKLFGTKRLGVLIGGILVELLTSPIVSFINSIAPLANITAAQVEQILIAIPIMVVGYIAGDTVRESKVKK